MSNSFETPYSHKTYTTLSMPLGPIAEPAITSEAFLTGFLTTGVWLRALALESHAKVLANSKTTRLQKLAASVAVYQQIGLAVEDAIVTLVAWSTWARHGDLNLADLYSRISLRLVSRPKPLETHDLDDFWLRIRNGRATIDGRAYLRALTNGPTDMELPALFGLSWKRHPSVHLVKGEVDKKAWAGIPLALRETIRLLINPKGEITTSCLNKIKHGPQVMLDSPRDIWIKRGCPGVGVQNAYLPNGQLIRILTQGSRTQESESELAAETHVAPFILDDPHNAYRWLNGPVMDLPMFFFLFGRWLHKVKFPEQPLLEQPSDPALGVLFRDNIAEFDRRAGTDEL